MWLTAASERKGHEKMDKYHGPKKPTGEGVEVEVLMGPGGAIGAVTLKLALSDSSRFQGQLLKSF